MKVTESLIQKAINQSLNLELSHDKSGVRRTDLDALPLLNEVNDLPIKKRRKVEQAIEIIMQKESTGIIFFFIF